MKKLLIIALISLFFIGCGDDKNKRYTFENKNGVVWKYDHKSGKVYYSRRGEWIEVAK